MEGSENESINPDDYLEKESDINFQIFNINPEPVGTFTLPEEKHLRYKEIINSILENAPEMTVPVPISRFTNPYELVLIVKVS